MFLSIEFRIVHTANILPSSTILLLHLEVLFVWFIWAVNLVCLTTLLSLDGLFAVYLLSSSATEKKSIAALAEIVCLVVCCGNFLLLDSLRWHSSACLVASHLAQSDCGGSKGVVGVHARVKRKSERSEMHLTCETVR